MPKVTEAHLEARRQQILDASFNCFARDGFHQTSMQDICREADLSPGAVYRYFSSKEEIIEASCAECQKQLAPLMQDAREQGGTLQVLDALVDVFFGMLAQPGADADIRVNIQLWGEALRSPAIQESLRRSRSEILEQLQEIVIRAQKSGEFNPGLDSQAIARVLLSMYDGLLLQMGIDPNVDIQQYVTVLKTLYSGLFWQGEERAAS